ncbi:MAG: beta-galactosidase [Acidobacteriaceae bacterium]|nr:beta-galactosidase [Acidobacteriaceae bacterium]
MPTIYASSQIGGQSGNLTWQKPIPRDFSEADWLDTGLVSVGNWEGLAFRTRTGGQNLGGLPVDLDRVWNAEHSEATVKAMHDAGVTFVNTNFYKTGVRSDHDDMETAKKFTTLCHKYGIKVSLYIGGTIFAETLLHDVPEAKNWIARDEYGQPIRYAPYRYVPDFDNPGFVAYMKTVIRLAITEVHPDMLHFDNLSLSPPPNTAVSPEVNRRFRAFLHAKYTTPAQLKARFGFSNIDAISVPTWKQVSNPLAINVIEDPVMEEWIDFRCSDLADYYRQMAQYARSLDKHIVVELNPHGVFGSNGAYLFGIDHPRLVEYGSIYSSEESNEAEVTAKGVLVSKIRSYKQARHLNETAYAYTGWGRANEKLHSWRLLMAESMAYNRNSIGDISEPLDVAIWPDDLKQYVHYFSEQNAHYRKTHPVADVAILRSFPSQAYNSGGPQLQSTLMEQVLIQYKIPFDIISDRDLPSLSRYRAVILANQESLTDQAVQQISDYVAQGGGLVATGLTSFYTQWHRRRSDFALASVFNVHANPIRPSFGSGGGLAHGNILAKAPAYQESTFGKGRTVYLSAVVPAGKTPATADIPPVNAAYRHDTWELPENAADLVKAVQYAAGAPFSVEFTKAPLTTTMELTDNADLSERTLHWLNYQLETPKVAGAPVSVALPAGKHVAAIEVISPDAPTQSIKFTEKDGRVAFTLPSLVVYNVAVMHLK